MPQSTENLLVVGIIPLVAVIVLLARFVLKNIKDIETITLKVATLEGDNEELRKENNELRAINVKWRQAARKWYQIAIAISPQLRDQVEDGLEEPTDL